MVAVMLATDRKAMEVEEKKKSIIDANWPCFVVAFTMASIKLALAYTGTEDYKIPGFNSFNVFFIMELGSTPLAIINPRVWFSMFMCSLAYMCVETGYPTIATLTISAMFMVIYALETTDYLVENDKKKNQSAYKILPLVDEEKLKKQEMV